jgi:NhaA family Na+:H+ antiporter
MFAAIIALGWANVAERSYLATWGARLTVGIAPVALSKPLLLWINDGLMAIFFLLVGLEIKREVIRGDLSSFGRALLPIVAAAAGMVVPAAIYLSFNPSGDGARGWGIPMATDVAFALGVLALLGSRVPPSLRVFLTAVAIADDIGAIVVIALFYTSHTSVLALVVSAGLWLALVVMNRMGMRHAAPYVVLGVALWVAVLKSGVHATVAGVLLAFAIPAANGQGAALLERLEHALSPWVAFGVMPVFALANAGVRLSTDVFTSLLEPISLGTIVGLVVGKQAGIALAAAVFVWLGLASLPSGASWRQLYGIAVLCGIGFTMSLFIATLALSEAQLAAAKIGVLTGSLLSGVAGYAVLAWGSRARIDPRATTGTRGHDPRASPG